MLGTAKRWLNGPGFPDQGWANWVQDICKHTPDMFLLERKEFCLLFCPDNTSRGGKDYHLVEESGFLFQAYTKDKFEYYQYGSEILGRQAIPLEAKGEQVSKLFPPHLSIKGEVLAIKPWQFIRLDNKMENGVQYTRRRVRLIVPYRDVLWVPSFDDQGKPLPLALQGKNGTHGPEKVTFVSAWMYVGNPEYWDNIIDQGFSGIGPVDSYESRRKWLGQYYSFKKNVQK